jgi:hypothetical protein
MDCVSAHAMRPAIFFLGVYCSFGDCACADPSMSNSHKAGSLKMNTALEYSTRVVQEGGRRCKKSKNS